MRIVRLLIVALLTLTPGVRGTVDILRDTSEVEDCFIYSWEGCNSEVYDEDCRRYNAGGIPGSMVGKTAGLKEERMLLGLPGWNGTIPDSSELLVYCFYETDTVDRRIFLYPLTREFFEGSEVNYNVGDYPDPDSGATWLHAYLDIGDADSVSWTNAGGDFTTTVACTALVTDTGQYFVFHDFNRVLTYWDTSGEAYGFILINENATPTFTSAKGIRSSEASLGVRPMVLLYTADETGMTGVRRRRAAAGRLRQ